MHLARNFLERGDENYGCFQTFMHLARNFQKGTKNTGEDQNESINH